MTSEEPVHLRKMAKIMAVHKSNRIFILKNVMALAKQNTQLLAKLQEAHKHFSMTITVVFLFVTI